MIRDRPEYRRPAGPTTPTPASSDTNAGRIIAYGMRNPYRFTIKPGTDEVWIGDVGCNTWEEVNRLRDPERCAPQLRLALLRGCRRPARVRRPRPVDLRRACRRRDVTVAVLRLQAPGVDRRGRRLQRRELVDLRIWPSCRRSSPYPGRRPRRAVHDRLHAALHLGVSARVQRAAGHEQPAPLRQPQATRRRADGGSVFLTIGPTGDLVYADYDRGEIRRIHYYGANVPPVASFTATPSFGPSPLTVAFDASGSSDANDDTLSYAWDLDADGAV